MAPPAALPPKDDVWLNSADSLFVLDVEAQGRFRLRGFNPAAERQTGLEAARVLGLEIGEFLPPDGVGHTREHLRLCVRERRPVTFIEVLGFPSGGPHWRTTLSPVLDAAGEVVRVLGRAELIRTPEPEDLLAEVELRAVLDGLPNGVGLVDRHGAIVFVNAAWRRFGEQFDAPSGLGVRYLDLCDDPAGAGLPDRSEVEPQLRELLAGEIERFELRYNWRGRHFLLRAGALAAGGVPRVALAHTEVSEVVAAQRLLSHAAEQLLQVQEEERARVARDLHDSTAQHLAAVNLGLARLRKTTAPPAVLDDMGAALAEAQREIRTLTYLLYPPLLSDHGLEATLKTFVYGFKRRTGLSVETTITGDLKTLPLDVQRAVFRVVQESLANVHRHAKATQAAIDIALRRGGLRVTVTDDGAGPSPPIELTLGMGIRGMQARFRQFDGLLTVSRRDGGTQVDGVIPASGLRRAKAAAR